MIKHATGMLGTREASIQVAHADELIKDILTLKSDSSVVLPKSSRPIRLDSLLVPSPTRAPN